LFVVLLTIKIKSKEKRRTRHVNGNENRNVSYMVSWWENVKQTDHLWNPRADGWLILKRIRREKSGSEWAEFVWLRIVISDGLL